MRLRNLALTFLSFIILPAIAQKGDHLFDDTYIHEIRMSTEDPDLWKDLLNNYDNSISEDHIYSPVHVEIDGTSMDSVGLRIKGFTSALFVNGKKKPFRIDFNEFRSTQQYDGLKKISLNNAVADPSSMRDMLAFNLMRKEGIHASRTVFAKVFINDEYWGLYVVVEQIDKTFLVNNFEDSKGNLYKCKQSSDLSYLGNTPDKYALQFELKTNEKDNDWSGFFNFINYLNKHGVSNEEYRENFKEIFDIDGFLKVMAIDILVLNWDSYYDHGRNFYLYENSNRKMTWIPWDYNFSFSDQQIDILAKTPTFMPTPKPLIRNLLTNPQMVNRLTEIYREILTDNFTTERLYPLIDQTKDLIREELSLDPNKLSPIEEFDMSLEQDQIVTRKDTVDVTYNLDSIYIVTNWNNIPDSILQSGIVLVDTASFDTITLDSIFTQIDTTIYIHCFRVSIYDVKIIGLKAFIQRRIDQVNEELSNIIITGIPDETIPDPEVLIFPNPTTDFINLSGRITNTKFTLFIFDQTGKILLQVENHKKIDVSDLAPGIYFIEIGSGSQKHIRKFIKGISY